jgi:hypothetical protein
MDLLEQLDCAYILGLPGNARLKDIAHPWCVTGQSTPP